MIDIAGSEESNSLSSVPTGGWVKSSLGHHVEVLTGYAFDSKSYSSKPTAIRLLRGDNVMPQRIRWANAKKWDAVAGDTLTRYALSADDVVVAMDRTWISAGAKVAQVKAQDLPSLLVQRVARLRAGEALDQDYMYQLLSGDGFERYVRSAKTETVVPHISPNQIKAFPIILPPLPEQRKIAEILRAWDIAIERIESKRVQLLQRRTGLVNKLLFSHGGPHGITWHETAPGWNIRPIGKVASDVSLRNVDLKATDVLTCSKHHGFVRSDDYFTRTVHSANLSTYKVICRGQFGFPSNHIEEGSIGLQNVVDVGVVSPIYTVFEFDSSLVDGDFAYLTLKTGPYSHMFDVSTSSSVDRRGSLRWPEFSKLPFPVPPLHEQRRIAEIASDADHEVDLVRREAGLLRTQKRGLMQKLLTGQVRVDVAAEIKPGRDDNE